MKLIIHFTLVSALITVIQCIQPPNIVIAFFDDMGTNDVGYHGSSQLKTPNIDAIAFNGIMLERFYTLPVCTPSRAALLTGVHPIRYGLQGLPILAGQNKYLPPELPTMAESLKGLGYETHLVGKWHLGSKYRNVTPTERGFDSHFGYWNGFCGYFDYEIQDQPISFNGFDLHDNFDAAYQFAHRSYATELFTDKAVDIIQNHNQSKPLFLLLNHLAPHSGRNGALETKDPEAAQKEYDYIENPYRRLYADMVHYADISTGNVFAALQDAEMLENTIVIVMSDNGAPTNGIFQNFGSNWPNRGQKDTVWEGGVKNFAAIYSPLLSRTKYAENTPIHISDLYPTLYAAAGGEVSTLGPLDGINQWPLFTTGTPDNTRPYILINYNDEKNVGAIMTSDGRYKLTQGSNFYQKHYGDSGAKAPAYNTSAVLNSKANKAILAATNNASLLTESQILAIRSQVTPKPPTISTTYLGCANLYDRYCLFDLQSDPRELKDIKNLEPTIFANLKAAFDNFKKQAVQQPNGAVETASNPANCNNTWFNWGEPIASDRCPY